MLDHIGADSPRARPTSRGLLLRDPQELLWRLQSNRRTWSDRVVDGSGDILWADLRRRVAVPCRAATLVPRRLCAPGLRALRVGIRMRMARSFWSAPSTAGAARPGRVAGASHVC